MKKITISIVLVLLLLLTPSFVSAKEFDNLFFNDHYGELIFDDNGDVYIFQPGDIIAFLTEQYKHIFYDENGNEISTEERISKRLPQYNIFLYINKEKIKL